MCDANDTEAASEEWPRPAGAARLDFGALSGTLVYPHAEALK